MCFFDRVMLHLSIQKMMYPSSPWKQIYSMCQFFPLLFVYPVRNIIWACRRVFLEKHRTLTIPMHMVHPAVFCFCFYFLFFFWGGGYIVFVYCSLSLNYILLISIRILSHFHTLSKDWKIVLFIQFNASFWFISILLHLVIKLIYLGSVVIYFLLICFNLTHWKFSKAIWK